MYLLVPPFASLSILMGRLKPSFKNFDLRMSRVEVYWTDLETSLILQVHHRVCLLRILLDADDAPPASTGEEDRLRTREVRAVQKHLCCSLLLPHSDRAAGRGRRPLV